MKKTELQHALNKIAFGLECAAAGTREVSALRTVYGIRHYIDDNGGMYGVAVRVAYPANVWIDTVGGTVSGTYWGRTLTVHISRAACDMINSMFPVDSLDTWSDRVAEGLLEANRSRHRVGRTLERFLDRVFQTGAA